MSDPFPTSWDRSPARPLCPWNFLGKNNEVIFPSPGIFPTQRLNPCPALAGGFFTTEPPGKPVYMHMCVYIFFLCIDHWGRLSYLSLLFFGNLHSDGCILVYLSFSPSLFDSLFTAICKVSSDSCFAFLHFFFLEMGLITASCAMSRTPVHSSSGTLSIRSRPLNLFLTSTV